MFIRARLQHENELNIHEHAVFVNKEPGKLHYGELNTNKHKQKFAKMFTCSRNSGLPRPLGDRIHLQGRLGGVRRRRPHVRQRGVRA